MQKIIPFQTEVNFKDHVSEVTSISLEHSLHKENENQISGSFIVSGEYKVVDTSSVLDRFSFDLPFDIHLDEKYDISKVHIDIDDFYYEVINNNVLSVHIDVLVDHIEEKEVLEEVRESSEIETIEEVDMRKDETPIEILDIEEDIVEKDEEIVEEREPIVEEEHSEEAEAILPTVESKTIVEKIEPQIERNSSIQETTKEEIASSTLTSIFENVGESGYATYHIYMVKEEDTIESIVTKYGIHKESLEKYNDLKEVKKGDKLIIPCDYREKN